MAKIILGSHKGYSNIIIMAFNQADTKDWDFFDRCSFDVMAVAFIMHLLENQPLASVRKFQAPFSTPFPYHGTCIAVCSPTLQSLTNNVSILDSF
uniref:Uncharacterized protein n=1 Tax=Arundo donax TaxID=35708 RepID=A0A0A9HQ68_ARUDO